MAQLIDYDRVADRYGRRYELHSYGGVHQALLRFAGEDKPRIVEVGCGSGHWLEALAGHASRLAGVDPSSRMLAYARAAAPSALLVRGRATALPFRPATFDRIGCVNALHHVGDRPLFFSEATRLLAPGGGLITAGLDPHTGCDRWWVYDYFDGTREFDLGRFIDRATLRNDLAQAGFCRIATHEVDRIQKRVSFAEALASGVLDRSFTSELTILSDDEYDRGLGRIRQAERECVGNGIGFELVTDLRLYATVAWL